MLVISNTSPILNLAIINQLELLRQQFSEILIPPVVLAELKLETAFPGVEPIRQALQLEWLRVVELENAHLIRALMLELDRGEAAAIALALELGIQRVLIDERDGRVKAKALGLRPTGMLGILLRAKREGQLASIEEMVGVLRHEAGFFIADDLFETILIEAGERN